LRAFDRISKRIVGLDDGVEAETIASLWIVGMVALSKITKYPLYRFRVGVRTDFQDFVIVGEGNGVHDLCPCKDHGLPQSQLSRFTHLERFARALLATAFCRESNCIRSRL